MSLLQVEPLTSCPAVRSGVPGHGVTWEHALLMPRANLTGALRFAMSALLLIGALAEAASISDFAGTGKAGFAGDGGPAREASLNAPFGITRGPDGAIWFCEYQGHVVRRIDQQGIITTIAGSTNAAFGGDGGPASKSALNHPHEIRFDRAGNLFIADTSNHAIRRIDAKTLVISTVAGTGKAGYSGDGGPAAAATLNSPISLQLDGQGNLFVGDIGNHVIRRIESHTGVIMTFAGTGKAGPTPDGAAITGTPLNGPRSFDIDERGDLWLATREGNQVLHLDVAKGVIRHVAGTGKKGYSGDGGPAKEATINGPKGIAVGRDGTLFLADTENHTIRRIDAGSRLITTLAGTGRRGRGADGDSLASALAQPHALWLEPDGTLFVSDSLNHRIRIVRSR
jgi:streptogramin lyase